MAGTRVLEFGLGLDFASMSYSDLAKYLEEYLERAKSLREVERLIKALNPTLKDSRYTEDERHELKKLRQRAYDRRRHGKYQTDGFPQMAGPDSNSKFGMNLEKRIGEGDAPACSPILAGEPALPNSNPGTSFTTQIAPPCKQSSSVESMQVLATEPRTSTTSFWHGAKHAFASIDGERLVRKLPAALLLLVSTMLVSALLWLQSVDLYESIGFASPQLTAAGSLLMVISFAGFHSLTSSKLALLLCVYMGVYESYFMVSGTIQDENARHLASVDADSELRFLREKLERAHATYAAANTRYQQKGSDVFMNSWFRKTHVDPAWRNLEAAQGATHTRLRQLVAEGKRIDITVLKVLYRLGLVLLSMLLVHRLGQACAGHPHHYGQRENHVALR